MVTVEVIVRDENGEIGRKTLTYSEATREKAFLWSDDIMQDVGDFIGDEL